LKHAYLLLLVLTLLGLNSRSARAQGSGSVAAAPAQEPPAGRSPEWSIDAGQAGCKAAKDLPPISVADLRSIVEQQDTAITKAAEPLQKDVRAASDSAILALLQGRKLAAPAGPDDIRFLIEHKASASVLSAVTNGPEVYIGWSVIPAKIVTDNYGHYVRQKYFAIDVDIANRATESLIVTALEFCHDIDKEKMREVSSDPPLVRGTLQKGELTGTRSIIIHSIEAAGDLAAPSAAFFKNTVHRGTFSAGAALFNPLKTGFDLVWPDTILTYLQNWDKDEVFKRGFVVSAGGSTRGRVFIPIELIYPRPIDKNDSNYADALKRWKEATHGNFDNAKVKKAIGNLVVLGQAIELKNQRRFVDSE
jgi:hypothetical protein